MTHRLRNLNIFLILFFGISLFIYLLMNGGAYWRVLRYDLFLHSPLASNDLTNGNILETPNENGWNTKAVPANGELIIGKIGVDAPIAIPRASDTKSVLASLEEGVGLYPGSVAPGEKGGRSIILGHSSRATWYRGEYATIFALLPKMAVGDTFEVLTPHTKYTYQVFARDILSPYDTNVLLSSKVQSDVSEIDLVTCYPIGSASKRTVIQAKLTKTDTIR